MKRLVLILLTLVVTGNAGASDGVGSDIFISSFSDDQQQILLDYKSSINSRCKRSTSIRELREFMVSKDFQQIIALESMGDLNIENNLNTISCERYKQN